MEVLARPSLFFKTLAAPMLVLILCSLAQADPIRSSEKLNASFVFRVISGHLNSEHSLCVIGDDPAMPHLLRISKSYNNISLYRKYINDDLSSCDIVYIGIINQNNIEKIIDKTKDSNSLTIANVHGFIHQGGVLQFSKVNNNIEVAVNYEKLVNVRVMVNEQILSMSEMIKLRK